MSNMNDFEDEDDEKGSLCTPVPLYSISFAKLEAKMTA